MSGYFPDRMIVGNVRGGALLTDTYLVAEWRVDPWKGFDLPEGFWNRTRRHEFEPYESRNGKAPSQMLRTIMPANRNGAYYRWTPTSEVRVERCAEEDVRQYFGEGRKTMVPFVSKGLVTHISPDLLGHLVRIIGGEPTHWTTMSKTAPLDAWDGRHWLGAVMPMLVHYGHRCHGASA